MWARDECKEQHLKLRSFNHSDKTPKISRGNTFVYHKMIFIEKKQNMFIKKKSNISRENDDIRKIFSFFIIKNTNSRCRSLKCFI